MYKSFLVIKIGTLLLKRVFLLQIVCVKRFHVLMVEPPKSVFISYWIGIYLINGYLFFTNCSEFRSRVVFTTWYALGIRCRRCCWWVNLISSRPGKGRVHPYVHYASMCTLAAVYRTSYFKIENKIKFQGEWHLVLETTLERFLFLLIWNVGWFKLTNLYS